MRNNEKGYTLIELLAVVGIGNLIEQSRQKAFVSQALHVKEAANLFMTSSRVSDPEQVPMIITYEMLINGGYIDQIEDPYSGKMLEPGSNKTTVTINEDKITEVCLHGERQKLCEQPSNLNTEKITSFTP